MKLKNRNPADFVGRTIIYRHQAWNIDALDGTTIYLSRPGLAQKGQLRHSQFADCRLYPTREEVLTQFPMLVRALRWACILSQSEAVGAIHGMITTGSYFMGSEAVAHVGGSANAIGHAWRCRHNVRRQAAALAAQ
jgi:hypothetical protein